METGSRLATFVVIGVLTIPSLGKAAGVAPQPSICDRTCWSARDGRCTIKNSSLNRAIIHHTAGPSDYNTASLEESKAKVRAVQNYHMDSNGWCDIGYHFVFDKLGYIFEAREGSMTGLPRGAHDGANTNSMGFSCLAYFHTPYNHQPTPELLDSLADCIAWRMPQGWAGPYGYPNCNYGSQGVCVGHVDSHRRVSATACPGDLMHNPYIGNDVNTGAMRAEINCRIQGTCGGGPGAPNPPSNLSATAISDARIDLSWSDNSSDEDSFVVGRSTTNGGPYTDVHTAAANTTSWIDTTVAASTTYYYVVRAENANGSSASSNQASASTPAPGGVADIIIDNPAASVVGSWSTGTSAVDKYGTDYRFKSGGGGSSWLQYTPNIQTAGNYNVYEWHSQGTNRTSAAQIQVNFDGGSQTVSLNQQSNGGNWNVLGTFSFAAGAAGNARVTDGHTDTTNVVIADAIKFEYAGTPAPPTAVHVNSITMSWVKQGKNYKSRAVVQVVNASGASVSGATVTGSFSGAIAETGVSAVTDSSGNATITSTSGISSGTVQYCVTGITGSNLSYDSAANVETCDSASR